MPLFSFLSGSYKPSYFKDKTIEEILKDVKLDKIDKKTLLETENEGEKEIYESLDGDIKSLIDMLIDYKDKEGKKIIFEKCYKGKGRAPKPMAMPMAKPASPPRPASARPMPKPGSPRPVPAMAKPMPTKPVEAEAAVAAEDQSGGGKYKRKSKKSKSMRSKSMRSKSKSKRSKSMRSKSKRKTSRR